MPAPALRLWGVPALGTALRFGPERRFQLLLVLGLQAGQWVERERLAALLWPDRGSSEARRNLRKVVFDVQALPGVEGLEITAHALRWMLHTDVAAFEAACRDDPAAALAWRTGPPLAGVDDPRNAAFTEWLEAQRARLEQAWLAAAAGLLAPRSGPPAERAALARQVLAVDALDEPAMAALLAAEMAQGHLAQAQAEYRRYAAALAQALGVEPSRALRDLLVAAPPAAAPGPEPAGFIGRRVELAALRRSLAEPGTRLLTLLGPGGMGKSSLARQLLLQSADLFPGGSAWVPLQDARAAAELPARVALALGLGLAERPDPLADLLQRWQAGAGAVRALLVLDNAEHLLQADDPLAPRLAAALAAVPGLVLLLTSRTRCGLPGELLVPLQGLAVPEADSRDLEAAANFDAVRLFERHARQVRRGFTLAAHLEPVLAICDAVAGLPLALELAASWVRLLPPETIAQDLRAGAALDVLQRDPAANGAVGPARAEHTSLRAVLQGSWALLGGREQQAMAALSVFEGGFTRAAAQAVAQCSLPLLSALADVSLVQADELGRFSLHPVVREFAAERLADAGSPPAALHERHAAHFAAWLAEQGGQVRSDPGAFVRGVAPEEANLRAAWRRSLAQARHDRLLVMATPLRLYYEIGGRLAEGLAELQAALELPGADTTALRLQATLRHAVSALMYRRGQLSQGLAVALAGIDIAQRCGERAALKGCLNNAGLLLWHQGADTQALPHLQRALAEAEADGDRHGMAVALGNAAIVKKALGRYEEALADNVAALALARELGQPLQVGARLNNIGNLHRALLQWQQARPVFAESVRVHLAHGLTAAAQFPRLNTALVDIELGDFEAAHRELRALLDAQREAPQAAVALSAELGLARLAIAQGRLADALPHLARVVAQARQLEFRTHPLQALVVFGEWLWAQGRGSQAQALWQWIAHQPGLDDADRMGAVHHLRRRGLPEQPVPGAWQPAGEDHALALLAAEAR
jgi:predicted ATPase/DNA-binding SARP family transcriptional activator